jgi:hypothetical protein
MLGYTNYMRIHSINNAIHSVEKKQTTKDVKYRFSQMVSKMSHKNIMNKKMKAISVSSNISNSSIIMASDMHATGLVNNTSETENEIGKGKGKSKSKKQTKNLLKNKSAFDFEEGTSIVNTYHKYFGS